jgi:hypothetical protein
MEMTHHKETAKSMELNAFKAHETVFPPADRQRSRCGYRRRATGVKKCSSAIYPATIDQKGKYALVSIPLPCATT